LTWCNLFSIWFTLIADVLSQKQVVGVIILNIKNQTFYRMKIIYLSFIIYLNIFTGFGQETNILQSGDDKKALFQERIIIQNLPSTAKSVEIRDNNETLILTNKLDHQDTFRLDITDLSKGIYSVEVYDQQKMLVKAVSFIKA
jgi:hypothetical protein